MRWTPTRLKQLMWLWPPYLGAGVRIEEAAEDGTSLTIRHTLRPWTKNAVGTVFGGTMQAMTDPFFMLLAMHQLGSDYVVWDTAGQIEFVKPGRGTIRAVIEMPTEMVEQMRAATADGSKFEHRFSTDIVDESGDVVAHVRRKLYVRKKKGR